MNIRINNASPKHIPNTEMLLLIIIVSVLEERIEKVINDSGITEQEESSSDMRSIRFKDGFCLYYTRNSSSGLVCLSFPAIRNYSINYNGCIIDIKTEIKKLLGERLAFNFCNMISVDVGELYDEMKKNIRVWEP